MCWILLKHFTHFATQELRAYTRTNINFTPAANTVSNADHSLAFTDKVSVFTTFVSLIELGIVVYTSIEERVVHSTLRKRFTLIPSLKVLPGAKCGGSRVGGAFEDIIEHFIWLKNESFFLMIITN